MALPAELVLIRHGESEGNFVRQSFRNGAPDAAMEEVLEKPQSEYRLTNQGIEQAKAAGAWIAENIGTEFDQKFFSYFIRTQETAGHLGLPGDDWKPHPWLYERRLGALSGADPEEYETVGRAQKREDPLHWRAVGGESTLDVAFRFDRVLATLHRHAPGGSGLLVCHGDVIAAGRVLLERPLEREFREWEADPEQRIHNCQVIHYTRRQDPENPGAPLEDRVAYVRSVCPWDESLSSGEWRAIPRRTFSNEELLEGVEYYPRTIGVPKVETDG